MPRLFVALRPPPAVRAALVALGEGVEGARWQDDNQLHVTLRWIGEVDRRTGEDVVDALSGVRAAPLTLKVEGLGRFGGAGGAGRGRGHALWAGVQPREAVTALHRKLDAALVRAGLPPEGRAYLPHVTLARGRLGAGANAWVAANAGLALPPFEARWFALYESTLGPEGARYEVVERWGLG